MDATDPTVPAAPTPATAPVSPWPMWVLGLVILIDQVDQNVLRGVIPQLKHDFGIGDAEIGLLLSIFVLVNGLITVPAGYLGDRWHRTRTIGHTVIAWSAITMITAAAQNFGQLLLGRAVLGFGQAITEPSANGLTQTSTRPTFGPAPSRCNRFSGWSAPRSASDSAVRSARLPAGSGPFWPWVHPAF